jgi:hypothetical protein
MPLDYNEFAEKIKQKYPEYKDVDNYTLTTKMIEKYPEYKTQVDLKKKEVSQSTLGQGNTSSARLNNTTTKPTASLSLKGDGTYTFPGQEGVVFEKKNNQWSRKEKDSYEFKPIKEIERVNNLEKRAVSLDKYSFEQAPAPKVEETKFKAVPKAAPKKQATPTEKAAQTVFKQNFSALDVNSPEYLKRKAEQEKVNNSISNVDLNLVGMDEEEAVPKLKQSIKDYWYLEVDESGAGYDEVLVRNKVTGESKKISLDNWTTDRDNEESKILRGFLDTQMNTKGYTEAYKRVNDLRSEIADATPTDRIALTEKLVDAQAKLTEEKNKRAAYVRGDKYLSAAIYDKNAQENIKTDLAVTQLRTEDYKEKVKDYEKFSTDVKDSYAQGKISKEDYYENYVPKLKAEKEMLFQEQQKLRNDYLQIKSDQQSIDEVAGDTFAIESNRGNVLTGTASAVLKGIESSVRFGLEGLSEEAGGVAEGSLQGVFQQLAPGSVSELYTNSENRSTFEKIVFGLSESGGAALAGIAAGGPAGSLMGLYASSYTNMKDQMNTPAFKDVPEWQKILMSSVYGATVGTLEELGISKWFTKSPAGKGLTNWILKKVISELPQDATAEAIDLAIKKSFKTAVANGLIQVTSAGLVEGSTELAQEGADMVYKDVFNKLNEKKFFENPNTWEGVFSRLGESFVLGFAGGAGMQSITQTTQTAKNAITMNQLNNIENLIENPNIKDIYKMNLKDQILSGEITSTQAKEQLQKLDELEATVNKIPNNVKAENKYQAFQLLNEREDIQKEIAGKDPALVAAQTERINAINEELKTISQNAVQEQTTSEVSVQPGAEVSGEMAQGESQAGSEVIAEEGQKEELSAVNDRILKIEEAASRGELLEDSEPGELKRLKDRKKELEQVEPSGKTGQLNISEPVGKADELTTVETDQVAAYRAEEQAELLNAIPEIESYKVNGEIDKSLMPAEVLAKYDEIYNKYDELISPLLETTEQPLKNLVTTENVNDVIQRQTTSVGQKIAKSAKLIMKALPTSKIYLHETKEDFDQAVGEITDGTERGAFIPSDGSIHINMQAALPHTLLHEAFHAVVLSKKLDNNTMNAWVNGLKGIVKDKPLLDRLNKLTKLYSAEEQSEEFISELGSIMGEAQKTLSTSGFQKFKVLINKIAAKIGLPTIFTAASTAQDAVDFINSISGKLTRGEEITQLEPYSVGEAASVKPNAPMKIKYQRKAEYDVDFVTNIPTKSLKDVVDKYDGKVFMIQSDATGVGYDSNGDPIYGGIGYIAIKENVDGKIGFASVDMTTAKTTISKMINRYGPNEKIVTLVMVQNPSSTVGNYYGGKYFGRGLIELQKQNKTNYKAIADSFVKFIESKQSVVDALNKNKTHQKLIELIKNPGKFDEVGFAQEFVKDTTFDVRREILKTLLPEKSDIRTNKSTPYIKQSLKDLGFNRMAFLNEYGDNTLFTEDMYASDEGGLLAAGFEITLPESDKIDEFLSGIENKGIEHHLFNGKLPYTDESFLLDGLYPVNENFSEFAKSQMVFNEENLDKDQLKKIVKEKFPEDKSYDDKYTRVNSKNFVKREDRTYTHLTSPNKIKFKAELQETNPQYFKEQRPDVSTDIARGMGFTAEKGAKQEALAEKARTKGFSKRKKQLIAPNGQPSNLNDKQWEQVRTPEFKKWFGDWENDPENASKVVDENGEPLVVYHGSRTSFEEFDSGVRKIHFRPSALDGFWFTSNKNNAQLFGENLMELFLNIKNPIDFDVQDMQSIRNVVDGFMDMNYFNYKKGLIKNSDLTQSLKNRIYKNNNDGVIYRNMKDMILADNFQAFEANQIKSATENVGTFSAETPKIKFQKQEAIQNAKEKYDLSVKQRGNTNQQGIESALGDLRKSDWYVQASDIERESAERELKKFFGEKMKAAPSINKITGFKPTKVQVDEAAALKSQLRLEARAAREAKTDLNTKRKQIAAFIRSLETKGTITAKQAAALVKRASSLNLDNPTMIVRFEDYAEKVFQRSEYQELLTSAFRVRRLIRKAIKSENQAEVVAMAKLFSKIDPSLVEDIDNYIELAENVLNAVRPSKEKGMDVALRQAANIETVAEYATTEIAKQEENRKRELMAEYKYLADSGVLTEDLSVKEMQEIINLIENPTTEFDPEADQKKINFLQNRLASMEAVFRYMLANNINPFTGEEVVIEAKDAELIKRLLKMDLNEMSVREAVKVVEAMDNFLMNNITSGLEAAVRSYEGAQNAKQLVAQGKKARPLRSYFNKTIGRFFGEQLISLPLLFEKMFPGIKNAANIMQKMGLVDVINGSNKAIRQHNELMTEYSKQDFYKEKGFMEAKNVYERGMLAFLKRNLTGTKTEVRDEFKRRAEIIRQSIEALKENGTDKEIEMADLYQEIYDKLGVSELDLDVIESRAEKMNKDATAWMINEWGKIYGELADVSLSVYNSILGSDTNYTPDRYKNLSSEDKGLDDALLNSGSGFMMSMDYTDKNKTGVLMEATRPKVLPKNEKGRTTRYISLDFDVNNFNSLKGALVDINTAAAIRQVDGFINSKSFNKFIPSANDRAILTKRINTYIQKAKGKRTISTDTIKDVERLTNFISGLGVGKALAGLDQPLKQTIPVMINTVINSGSTMTFVNADMNEAINRSGMPIANRGLEAQTTVQSIDRLLEKKDGTGAEIIKWIENANQFWLKTLLAKPDVWVARSSFITYYLKDLKSKGVNVKDIDWSTHQWDQDSAQYAQIMVDRQQNISDDKLAGEFLSSDDPTRRIVRKVIMPFATFIMNQKARMHNDFLTIRSKDASIQDRKSAAKSLAGLGAELAAYQLIAYGIKTLVYDNIANWLVGDDDEEEKKDKSLFGLKLTSKQYSATKFPVKSIVADIISPLPIFDDLVTFGFDEVMKNFPQISDEDVKKAVEEKNTVLRLQGKDEMDDNAKAKFIDQLKSDNIYSVSFQNDSQGGRKYGMIGIAYDTYKEMIDLSRMAYTGEFEDEYQGRVTNKYLPEEDRKILQNISVPLMLAYSTGLLPKDLGTVARKVTNIVKRKGVTENQHEKEKEVKKQINRDLNEWEFELVKTRKKADGVVDEINYVESKGGLDDKQGREYVKLMEAFPSPSDDMLRDIQKGMTADQIIKRNKE